MDTPIVTNQTQYAVSRQATGAGQDLGKDAFMRILVSQLLNQDPMNPMEDKDFIAQMAQFSMLEQLQTLNAGQSFAQASSLIGKIVQTANPDPDDVTSLIRGVVTGVSMEGANTFLDIGGVRVPFSGNIAVFDSGQEAEL